MNPEINIHDTDVVLSWVLPKDNGMELKEESSKNNKVGQLTYQVEYCPQKNEAECEKHVTNSTYLSLSKQVKRDLLYKFTVIPINGYGIRGEAHTSYQFIPKSKSIKIKIKK